MRFLTFVFALFAIAPAVAQDAEAFLSEAGATGGHWTVRYLQFGGDAMAPLEGLTEERADLELREAEDGTVTGTLTEAGDTVTLTGKVTYGTDAVRLEMSGEVEMEGRRYLDHYVAFLLPKWNTSDGQFETMAGTMTRLGASGDLPFGATGTFVAVADF